jgi:hypothetical protein
MKHAITCVAFRRFDKNTLIGFASIRIEEIRLIIHDVALHHKGGGRWAQLPAKPLVRDGVHVVDDDGKAQYATLLEFSDMATRDAFSHAVWAAVLARHPELEQQFAQEPAT